MTELNDVTTDELDACCKESIRTAMIEMKALDDLPNKKEANRKCSLLLCALQSRLLIVANACMEDGTRGCLEQLAMMDGMVKAHGRDIAVAEGWINE